MTDVTSIRAPARFVAIDRGTAFRKPDGRGWVGIACYSLVLVVLGMIWFDRTLLNNDFFKVIATAIVLTGWNNGPVGWAYQATKSGGELADRNAGIVERQAEPAQAAAPAPAPFSQPEPPAAPVSPAAN